MRKVKDRIEEVPKPEKRTSDTIEFLPVQFTPAERLDIGEQLARAVQSRQDAEDQKKAKDAEHKQLIEALNMQTKRLTRRLSTGSEMRNVSCRWLLEDPTPREKTLVRLDTGETVRTVPMQDHDYQMDLPEPIPPANGKSETLVLEPPPANGSQPTNGAEAH